MVGSAVPINETDLGSATRTIRAWFYLVTPQESTPDKSLAEAYEPIDFVGLSVPFFILCVLL